MSVANFCSGAVVEAAAEMDVEAEYTAEGRSELSAHAAVEDEVGRTVDQDENVPNVAEWYVDVVKDALIHGTGQSQQTLRQLRQNKGPLTIYLNLNHNPNSKPVNCVVIRSEQRTRRRRQASELYDGRRRRCEQSSTRLTYDDVRRDRNS